MNKFQEIYVEKVTINVGVGAPGEKLEKAQKLLKNLTNMKPIITKTKRRIPGWGLRPGLQIGCKVTLRDKKADEFLRRLFVARNNTLKEKNFDNGGNLSFGIPEYLDIPGAEYDMQVGIIGLEAAVTLARPGFRIKHRRVLSRKTSKKHRISGEEAINFIRDKYLITITKDAE